MKDSVIRISVCPRCGKTYTAPPATARDGSGPICPDCGTREALESIWVDAAEQDKMLSKGQELRRNVVEFLTLEERVPRDHLLRRIDEAIDFGHLYDFVDMKGLYSEGEGRPSVDPVVLFKIVLIQHLYGIGSLRQTMREIDMNMAYRWFLGYNLNDEVAHFSTVSYNFRHWYTEETIEQV